MQCGRHIDSLGHHRASCTTTGTLGRRGFALESAAARVCKQAGARVTTNVMVSDLDLPALNATDSRRLEVVVDGLPLFGGSQFAVDTTLVCSLHSDCLNAGRPRIHLAFLLVFCHSCGPRTAKALSLIRLLHRSPDCQVTVTPPDSVPQPCSATTVKEIKDRTET